MVSLLAEFSFQDSIIHSRQGLSLTQTTVKEACLAALSYTKAQKMSVKYSPASTSGLFIM